MQCFALGDSALERKYLAENRHSNFKINDIYFKSEIIDDRSRQLARAGFQSWRKRDTRFETACTQSLRKSDVLKSRLINSLIGSRRQDPSSLS